MTRGPLVEREALAGLVERVTFHNADSGFCVLRVKVRGQRDLVTVVGAAAAVSAGEFIQASGIWLTTRPMPTPAPAPPSSTTAAAKPRSAAQNTKSLAPKLVAVVFSSVMVSRPAPWPVASPRSITVSAPS